MANNLSQFGNMSDRELLVNLYAEVLNLTATTASVGVSQAKLEARVASLEKWRNYLTGAWAAVVFVIILIGKALPWQFLIRNK